MAKLEVRAKTKLYYKVVRKEGHTFELTDKAHFEPRTMEWVKAPAKAEDAKADKAAEAAKAKADAKAAADAEEAARKEAEATLKAEADAANAAEQAVHDAQNAGEKEPAPAPTPAPRARRRRAQG